MSAQNAGRAVAGDVRVWLVFSSPDVDPTTARAASTVHELGTLVPGDTEAKSMLTQLSPFPAGKVERDGLIVASWTDGNGPHVAEIGKLTVFE